MTQRRVLASLLVLIVTVGAVSAVGIGGAGAAGNESAASDGLIEDADSYTYDIETESTTVIETDDEVTEISSGAVGSGAVDAENERLTETRTTTTAYDGAEDEREATAYVVDGTLYTDGFPGDESEWVKTDLEDNETGAGADAAQFGQAERYQHLAEAADAEVVGQEAVNGTETTVVEFSPDWNEYAHLMAGDLEGSGTGAAQYADETSVYGDDLDGLADEFDVTVTVWLDDETNQPVKAVTDAYLCVTGDTVDESDAEADGDFDRMTVTATETIHFDDHDENVTVELPEDAENATDLEDQFDDADSEDDAGADESDEADGAVDEDDDGDGETVEGGEDVDEDETGVGESDDAAADEDYDEDGETVEDGEEVDEGDADADDGDADEDQDTGDDADTDAGADGEIGAGEDYDLDDDRTVDDLPVEC